uniref:Minor capsid protein L2 n=1 Tax=Human papillomavirus TaxID=10566 RepID=A0A385PL32_9PAPI|nr:MAG: L2 protein [Human papillomavirus]
MYKVRRKRASPEDLYRTCATGDCPEDVKNKIEHNTLADRLLKWFSSFLFFGNLGIGTGRGTGGTLGYRPIAPTTTRPTPDTVPIRPSVIIDAIGPSEIVPVDAIQPGSSSILTETSIIDPSVVDIVRPSDGLEAGEVDAPIDPVSGAVGPGGHPSITTTSEEVTAILDVSPTVIPSRVVLDTSTINGDASHFSIITATTHPSPEIHVFVDPTFAGETVGYEEIPLESFNSMTEFDIEEAPQTSTPIQRIENTINQAKRLYNRFTAQVAVKQPEFLTQVSRLTQFEYENPAFDPNVSIEFERDLQAIEAAPNPEFQDIRLLHRPELSLTAQGTVRVSRLGERATMVTRSGLRLGQAVHFYYDISPIETIELETLGIESGDTANLVNEVTESVLVDQLPEQSILQEYSEDQLLDPLNENFSNTHLIVNSDELGETFTVPSLPPGTPKIFVDAYGSSIVFSYPQSNTIDVNITAATLSPAFNNFQIIDNDFYLHPALYPRKRRRLDLNNI